ncbi:hypothetical protein GCM10023195_49850 [Actinoallomurus liliacearum]|uniref:Sodium/calcium exchanger membrane region domain-containing protein n=2 Tax=Actinoallomurus liliacearum TaxID=1080073 RepID=A0ABP8TRH6_9ACTN
MLVAGALVFTNAVEWAGIRLDLGHGAVGSVLAAVATAMPESLVPVVAIVRGEQGDPIAIGAIVGAPFLLGTLAMALCGIAAMIYRVRREGAGLRLDRHAMSRDLHRLAPDRTRTSGRDRRAHRRGPRRDRRTAYRPLLRAAHRLLDRSVRRSDRFHPRAHVTRPLGH